MEDLEDDLDRGPAHDLLDDVAHQVAELSLAVPTHRDLFELRLRITRAATEVARLSSELDVLRSTGSTGGTGGTGAGPETVSAAPHAGNGVRR